MPQHFESVQAYKGPSQQVALLLNALALRLQDMHKGCSRSEVEPPYDVLPMQHAAFLTGHIEAICFQWRVCTGHCDNKLYGAKAD